MRQEKYNFSLQKEEEKKFKLEQERIKAQFEQKQEEVLQLEMERRREIFKTADKLEGAAKAERKENVFKAKKGDKIEKDVTETAEDLDQNNNGGSRVYRPQVFLQLSLTFFD